jgi:alpha/beta superfamily hydrolase
MQITSENTIINGAVGAIEVIIDSIGSPLSTNDSDYVAVCCHPHPQHGGAMTNKVIYTASRTIAGLGIVSLRFNFRGVGKSEGSYAEGIGEQDDLAAVVTWAKKQYPNKRLILAGFSFGAYISAMQSSQLCCELLISIAPPIGRIEFTGFKRPNVPWLVIQGEQDELVESSRVRNWVAEFENTPQLESMSGASHFFHGKLVQLREVINQFCISNISV